MHMDYSEGAAGSSYNTDSFNDGLVVDSSSFFNTMIVEVEGVADVVVDLFLVCSFQFHRYLNR